MTTLLLARAIAAAVREAGDERDAPTLAVLEVLHRTGHWFVREDVDADGIAVSGTARRLE